MTTLELNHIVIKAMDTDKCGDNIGLGQQGK